MSAALALRRLHTYLSIASAPTILFFSLTGGAQLFGWHESAGAYHPPAWVEKLGTLHKKQRFAVRSLQRRSPDVPPAAAPLPVASPIPALAAHPRPPTVLRVILLRWVFLFATLSLILTTAMGLWLGLTHARRKRLGWLLLALGIVIPAIFVGS